MQPKFNVWFEIDDEVATSRWRIDLLAAIGREGSITAGAEAMGVPYRVAWQKIREMEDRLGEQLLITQTGGSRGGGAVLTDAGQIHVDRMQEFCERSDAAIETIYRDVFGNSPNG
ncbi:MAG: LysR family transcriptional regulator [Acidimicrobiia bacterium]